MLSVNQTKSAESQYGDFSTYAKINLYERAEDEKGRYIYKFSNGEINPLFNASLNSYWYLKGECLGLRAFLHYEILLRM